MESVIARSTNLCQFIGPQLCFLQECYYYVMVITKPKKVNLEEFNL